MEKNPSGKPQGRVVSPLLADLYLDGLNKAVNERNQMKAVMVRFADDLVVLCRKGQGWVVAENHPRLPTLLERRNSQHSRAETITNPF
jgi:retron-type reverse transcriptase